MFRRVIAFALVVVLANGQLRAQTLVPSGGGRPAAGIQNRGNFYRCCSGTFDRRRIIATYKATGRPCACPEDTMRNGRKRGSTSAWSKPGGYKPLCYPTEMTAAIDHGLSGKQDNSQSEVNPVSERVGTALMGRLSKTPAVPATRSRRWRGSVASTPASRVPGAARLAPKGWSATLRLEARPPPAATEPREASSDTLLGARAKLGTVELTTRGEVLLRFSRQHLPHPTYVGLGGDRRIAPPSHR